MFKHKNNKIFNYEFNILSLVNLFLYLGFQLLLTGLPLFEASRGADSVYVGSLTTVASLAAVLVLPVSGFVVDVIGRKITFIASIIIMIVLSIGFIFYPTGVAGILIRLFQGLAWGFLSTVVSTLPLDIISPRRLTESMAIFTVFSSIAQAVSPSLASFFAQNHCEDWIIYSYIIFTVLSLFFFMFLFKSNYKEPEVKKGLSLKESFKIDRLINKKALFPSIIACFMAASNGTIQTFFNLMCKDRGLNATYIYFATFAVTVIVFKPIVGKISDKYGYFIPGIVTFLLCGISMFSVAFTNSDFMLFISGIVVGLGMGCSAVVLQAMAVSRADASSKGAATATYKLFLSLGLAMGGILSGVLVDYVGYTGMFIAIGIIEIIDTVAFVAFGRKKIESYHVK